MTSGELVPITDLAIQSLSTSEADDLAAAEATIRAGLDTFVDVGNALLVIRDGRLYRTTHGTFETYCRDRWELSDRRARMLVDAASVVTQLQDQTGTTVPVRSLPTSERQARPLTQLRDDPAAVRETWQRAVDTAPRDEHGTPKVTAAHVEDVVQNELAARNTHTPAAPTKPRKQRTDVVATVNRALQRAQDAAQAADGITRQHLAERKEEAAVWARNLSNSVQSLQRLLDLLMEDQ